MEIAPRRKAPLREVDPTVFELIQKETAREEYGLEMIPSENFVSEAVLEAMGSVLTNKYAEGQPHKRYYGGCEVVDEVEELAQARAKQLFGSEMANVSPIPALRRTRRYSRRWFPPAIR